MEVYITWSTHAAVVVGVAADRLVLQTPETPALAEWLELGCALQVWPAVEFAEQVLRGSSRLAADPQLGLRCHDAVAQHCAPRLHGLQQSIQRLFIQLLEKGVRSTLELLVYCCPCFYVSPVETD